MDAQIRMVQIVTAAMGIVFPFIRNALIAALVFRLCGKPVRGVRCVLFSLLQIAYAELINLATIELVAAANLVRFNIPWSLLVSLRVFCNPFALALYNALFIRVLGIPRQSVKKMSLMTFCAFQLPVCLMALTEAISTLVQAGYYGDTLMSARAFLLSAGAEYGVSALILIALWFLMGRYIRSNAHKVKVFLEAEDGAQARWTAVRYAQIVVLWLLSACFFLFSAYNSGSFAIVPLCYAAALVVIHIFVAVLNYTLLLRDVRNANLAETNRLLLGSLDNFRGIKHDFNNILQIYGGYFALEDYAGLKKYHESLVGETVAAGEQLTLQTMFQDSPAVLGVMLSTLDYAKNQGVDFQVLRASGLTNTRVPEFDLCRVLSILLNNAVEHAAGTEGKTVTLAAKPQSGGRVAVVIANSVPGKVSTADIFRQGYTTKENHMGQGLVEVNRILARHFGCTIMPSCTEDTFTMFLSVPLAGK